MRGFSFGAVAGCIIAFCMTPASAETREEYLARLKEVCAEDCMQPRQLLREARKRGMSDRRDLAGILDIKEVSIEGGTYRLHTADTNFLDRRDFALEFGMPENKPLTLENSSDITVEMDEVTLFRLLDIPLPDDEKSPEIARDGSIIVEGDRDIERPTLGQLRSLFLDRRIVVRGQPRLEAVFKGARRDHKNRKLTLELLSADDLVMLPRYDEEGNPVFDERQQELAESYGQ